MRNFKSLKPTDMNSLLEVKGREGSKAFVLAGGTNISNYIKQGRITEGTLLDISKIERLKGISDSGDSIEIGAATTISEILDSGLAMNKIPFFVESMRKFANPLIRNLATIGGNIADASPVADTAPLLLVMDAIVIAQCLNGTREIPINKFFDRPRKTNLHDDEIITAVRLPYQNENRGIFLKMGERNSSAISVVSVAVMLSTDGSKIDNIRIAAGGVAPKPVRVELTENLFKGKEADKVDIPGLAEKIKEEVVPISDVRGSLEWRREITANLTARAIMNCLGREE